MILNLMAMGGTLRRAGVMHCRDVARNVSTPGEAVFSFIFAIDHARTVEFPS